MSLTLGEKLRQARDARGITISEVAEQTRISALYIESIENNDYQTLPGGIFNKGFVKSYAKYVGVDEQEALRDYNNLIAEQGGGNTEDRQTYRSEVLTDDRSRSSLLPTIIFAVIILGLMVWGILALLNYYHNSRNQPVANTNANKSANANTQLNADSANANQAQTAPLTGDIKVEFKVLNSPVSLTSNSDGTKANRLITSDKPAAFDLKQSLYLSYSKNQSANVQLTLNGKQINLPREPANPKRNPIELTITKETAAQIYQSGAITFAAPDANPNIAPRP